MAMQPEEVPADLLSLAIQTELARRHPRLSAEFVAGFEQKYPVLAEPYSDALSAVLAAVIPVIQRQERERIAADAREVADYYNAELGDSKKCAALRSFADRITESVPSAPSPTPTTGAPTDEQ